MESMTLDTDRSTTATDRPDLSQYRGVHGAMRIANQQLVEGIAGTARGDRRRAAALVRWFQGYGGELRAHHLIEDDLVFPNLVRRAPELAELDAQLAADHHRLDEVIDGIGAALARMASGDGSWTEAPGEALTLAIELRDLLVRHLDVEDDVILPTIERRFTVAEWEEIDGQVMEHMSLRQTLFTVPWWMATVDDETAAASMEDAPFVLRVIWLVTRRRYARLVRRAFGTSVPRRR